VQQQLARSAADEHLPLQLFEDVLDFCLGRLGAEQGEEARQAAVGVGELKCLHDLQREPVESLRDTLNALGPVRPSGDLLQRGWRWNGEIGAQRQEIDEPGLVEAGDVLGEGVARAPAAGGTDW
jgi:hypothetical protein